MKDTFILYTEYSKHLTLLSMEQRGVLFTAIMCYQTEEELPEMDDVTAMAFSFIRSDLERCEKEYQKKIDASRENGKLGGRPKKETETQKPNGLEEKPKKPKGFFEKPKKANGFFENPNEHDSDNDSDYISSVSSIACVRAQAEKQGEDLQAFLEDHPQVEIDITNPSLVSSVDFPLLSQKISESKFLQTRYSLSWLLGNYRKIVSDAYKDFRRAPPKGDAQLECLKQLYAEAVEEDRLNEERNSG